MKISGVAQMRAMDRRAIDRLGIPDQVLMENAGRAAFEVLAREYGIEKKRYVIFCGAGNNAGDGLVVSRHILSNGGIPHVFFVGDPDRLQGAAKANLAIASGLSIRIDRIADVSQIREEIFRADGIVDAIFGTGLDREVEGTFRDVIELINQCPRPVLSLDIPSGVNGDTGAILGAAVRADHTVTFGLPKRGNMLYPGYALCGKLHLTHISFPPFLYEDETIVVETNDDVPLPERDATAHKGSVGDVLFIAGAAGYYGAPFFSAMSFLKAGGGYARLAAPASIAPFIAVNGSEIVFVPQAETNTGSLSFGNLESLVSLAGRVDMVVIGPGLTLSEETGRLIREIVASAAKPLLIDGDGITAVAKEPDVLAKRGAPTVLTPHLGEMARLSGRSVEEIERDKIGVLQQTCGKLNAHIVLKGAHSLIGAPDGRVFVNMTGNAGMATAGVGDVLTGTIAAMFGQGLPFEEAVRKGVFLHGRSGDLAATACGQDGITARDVLNYLPEALRQNRKKFAGQFAEKEIFIDIV